MASQSESELGMLAPIDAMMHPYRDRTETVDKLPTKGRNRAEIVREMEELRSLEQRAGKTVSRPARSITATMSTSSSSTRFTPCSRSRTRCTPDIWPSAAKFEAEIVSMTAHMLGAGETTAPFGSEEGICGSVSSGGSESILLAMKTYRDWAPRNQGHHRAGDRAARFRRTRRFTRRPSISTCKRKSCRWTPSFART